MGSISKLLGMLPGMGQIKDQINNIDERDVDRTAAIIKSMTPGERQDPTIINGSRRARIAKGSGVEVSAVKNLVERFFEARKMMSPHGPGRRHARDAGHARHGRRPRPAEEADQAGQGQAALRQPDEAQGRGAGGGRAASRRRPRAARFGLPGSRAARTSSCRTSSRSSWADGPTRTYAQGRAPRTERAPLTRVSRCGAWARSGHVVRTR